VVAKIGHPPDLAADSRRVDHLATPLLRTKEVTYLVKFPGPELWCGCFRRPAKGNDFECCPCLTRDSTIEAPVSAVLFHDVFSASLQTGHMDARDLIARSGRMSGLNLYAYAAGGAYDDPEHDWTNLVYATVEYMQAYQDSQMWRFRLYDSPTAPVLTRH